MNPGLLGQIGRYCATHFRSVVIAWGVLFAGLGFLAPKAEDVLAGAGWKDSGSESVAARELIEPTFPGQGAYAVQVVVQAVAGSNPVAHPSWSARSPPRYPPDMEGRQITVALGAEHADKLAQLAARSGAGEEPLAESLLAGALDNANPDPARVTELLEGIPGALERAGEGSRQFATGATIPLDEL